jgi:hypothetical protein
MGCFYATLFMSFSISSSSLRLLQIILKIMLVVMGVFYLLAVSNSESTGLMSTSKIVGLL